MEKCEICGRECNGFKGLSMHIRMHKIKPEEYYLTYINPVKSVCKVCGNETKFISLRNGYYKHCGIKCSQIDPDVRLKHNLTCMINLGVENPSQSDVVKKKKEKTSLKNNGCLNPSQSKFFKLKLIKSCMINLGVENPSQSDVVKKKKEITNLKNNGCLNPSQNKKIAKKISETQKLKFHELLERYPDVVLIENLIEGPNGEILGHCKNADCHNSIENGGRFVVNSNQVWHRNKGINSTSDSNYFYCCDDCKKSCIAFGRSSATLNNIFSYQDDINRTSSSDLYIWRKEVFIRQLKDNKDHLENFCEICHKTENLVGHHILPQKLYPEFALDPDNGVILCSKCHTKYGHRIGTECSTGYLANKVCK
jgi:5-methylcytosine-specific restriction endonuclease McrA